MKRTIYTIAFILLAQISFGQIKTIKVRGAGGGGVTDTALISRIIHDSLTTISRNDSTIIYTKYPLQVIDSPYIVGPDTLHKYTIEFRSDSLPQFTYADGVDTAAMGSNVNNVPSIKWLLPRLGSGGSGTVSNIATGYGLSGGPITTTGTVVADSAALSLKYLRIKDSTVAYVTPYQSSLKANNSNTVTVNGSTQTLGSNPSFTVSGSGFSGFTKGSIPFFGSGNILQENNSKFYRDSATGKISIGKIDTTAKLNIIADTVTVSTPLLKLKQTWNNASTVFQNIISDINPLAYNIGANPLGSNWLLFTKKDTTNFEVGLGSGGNPYTYITGSIGTGNGPGYFAGLYGDLESRAVLSINTSGQGELSFGDGTPTFRDTKLFRSGIGQMSANGQLGIKGPSDTYPTVVLSSKAISFGNGTASAGSTISWATGGLSLNSPFGIYVNPLYPLDVSGQTRIAGNSGKVGTIGASNYSLSVQNNASTSWIEILNNGGAGKGAFFGMNGNNLQLWNYQGGDIDLYSNPTASSGTKRVSILANGNLCVGNNTGSSILSVGTSSQFQVTSAGLIAAEAGSAQVALVAGTKVITITGLTTSSLGFVQMVSPSGITTTAGYKAVCTANTLTITAYDNTGATATGDVSTVNYRVIAK